MTLFDMTQAAFDGRPTQVETGWGQGRSTFGGVIGSLLVARMRGLLTEPRPLRSVSLSLAAPVAPGPVELEAEVLREGRSVTLAQAVLRQDGALAATAQAAFGASRPSSLTIAAARRLDRPQLPPPRPVPAGQLPPGTPEFFHRVEIDFADGNLPFSGADRPDFGGWMRLRDRVPRLQVEHLVALVDSWPPAVTPMLTGPTPVSTLTWTVELLAEEFSGLDFWQYQVRTDACHHGYAHTGAHVWNAAGDLVVISRQTVTIFG